MWNPTKTEEFLIYNINELVKTDKFKKAMHRNNLLTSTDDLSYTVEEHKDGYYYIGRGTRVKVTQFITRLGESIRKPRNSKPIRIHEIFEIADYNISN